MNNSSKSLQLNMIITLMKLGPAIKILSAEIMISVVWAHVIALITRYMSTTDGATDQTLFYDLEWIYYCLIPKTIETSDNKILFITFSTNQST